MKQRKLVILVFFIMIGIVIGLLTGCADSSGINKALTAAEVEKSIQPTVNLSEMQRGDAETLRRVYKIEESDVEDFVLYTALSNVKADELAVIKVKDASGAESVMELIQQRVEAQTVKFKDYRPEEYYLIEKHVLKAKGPFIFFAVSKDAESMGRAFDDALK